jgi:cell division protein FtsQ
MKKAESKAEPKPDRPSAPVPESVTASKAATVTNMSTRRRPRWGRRLTIVVSICLVLSALGVLLANVTPWMKVEDIRVTGNKFVTTQAVAAVVDDAKGKPLPQVDARGLEMQLAEIPGVARARVAAEPPHGLRVTIIERAPVAQVQQASGVQLIDSDGKVITTVKDASAYKLPAIAATTAAKPAVFQALTTALASIPASILGDMQEARATSPDSVELLMSSGLVVVWGNQDNAAQKAATLSAMLDALSKRKPDPVTGAVPQPVQTIDVSVPGSPVTK